MEIEVAIKELTELGKKNQGFVTISDVLKYCKEDSDEYDAIEKALTEQEIDIVANDGNQEKKS